MKVLMLILGMTVLGCGASPKSKPRSYPEEVSFQNKYALVIGNAAYTRISKLNNPLNDANDMASGLEDLGFTVDKVLNGSREEMETAVFRLKERLSKTPNSCGFLFYAGHGVQSNGQNYLIPVDADISSENYLRDRAVPLQAVLGELRDAGNALNIVVLDACRDNPFIWARSGSRGLVVEGSQPADSIVVYATSAGSTAADGEGRNGLFTGHLLNNLKTAGISVRDLFDRTGSDVRKASESKQVPAIYSQFFEVAYLGTRPAPITPQPLPVVQTAPIKPAASPKRPVPNTMVRIKGGTFKMGSPASEADRRYDETQHTVTVGSFYMGKYEVTQKEYQEVMGTNPSYFKGDNLPVECVSWYDAVEYCNALSRKEGLTPAYTIDKSRSDSNNQNSDDTVRWVVTWNRRANGYRLPTEAEWEYACRAGTTTPFNIGDNITTNLANYNRGKTTAVGSFMANPWGLYDMHGNVWEWCWDWYGNYSTRAQTNPLGASSGSNRVLRGGSWDYDGQDLRSAARGRYYPSDGDYGLGFRLLRP